ncbi:MAG: hypothetical protein LBU16_09840 [Treponema sp.]|jgi:hypothetical protein|nr:hypothetical protein [Treponema sp.]
MKSITLHGISEELDQRIAEKCRETGLSQNKTVIQALENALLPSPEERRRAELMPLVAAWTDEDLAEFEKNTADFEIVDESDWKLPN